MLTPLLIAVSLCTPAPASVDVTETVVLKYWSVVQVEDVLLHNGGIRSRGLTGGGLGEPKNIIPPGIRAWTVDEEHNRLTFIGDEAGIAAVKNLIQLLDVRPRRLSVHIRFLRMKDGPDPQGARFQNLEDPDAAELKDDENTRGWTLRVANDHPVRFRGPALETGAAETFQEITPRVNGDGSITVRLTTAQTGASQPVDPEGLNVLRRIQSGHGIAVAFPRQGKVMWIWATLLPDDPAPQQQK